jgi:hypothetical protein
MWGEVFAAPGAHTSGTTAANYAVTLPWHRELPTGVEVIQLPTPNAWVIG